MSNANLDTLIKISALTSYTTESFKRAHPDAELIHADYIQGRWMAFFIVRPKTGDAPHTGAHYCTRA